MANHLKDHLNPSNSPIRDVANREWKVIREMKPRAKSNHIPFVVNAVRHSTYYQPPPRTLPSYNGQNGTSSCVAGPSQDNESLTNKEVLLTTENYCKVCWQEQIDTALVKCGHLCLCQKCAMKVWKGDSGNGYCPICRAVIIDVLRVYKA